MIFDRLFASRQTGAWRPGWAQSMMSMLRLPLAGVKVDEHKAMTYAAVWACIRILSESIAVLPWSAYRQSGEMRELQAKHPVHRLLHRRPNREMTPLVFKRTLVAHAVSWGNGYAEIERNRVGDPIALWIVTPDRVTPSRDDNGELIYKVANPDGSTSTLRARDMFHLPGLGFDGVQGYSVLTMARESISLGMATEQFGAAFFGNGAQPGLVITQEATAQKLSPDAVKNLIASFTRKNQGPAKAGKVNYVDAGMTVTPIGIPQKDAQFLETRKFQILEVCRWFRVSPHKLADLDRASFANIESQNIEHVSDTLLPWIVALEQEADFKLFREGEQDFYTKLNINMLMRGDSAARKEFYTAMFNIGVFSIDDVLGMEDMNPLPGGIGKLRMVPMNYISVEHAVANGGTSIATTGPDKRIKALWSEPAQRMVNKELRALERIAGKADPKAEIVKFYESHRVHIAESFAAIAEFSGVGGAEERAAQYCAMSVTAAGDAAASGSINTMTAEWRFKRAEMLMQMMGCPHV